MLGEYGPLAIFSVIIISGIVIATPLGRNMNIGLNDTRRMLLGLIIVETGTLLTSMWTEVIHREIAATGGTNSSALQMAWFNVESVIGDSDIFRIFWYFMGNDRNVIILNPTLSFCFSFLWT